MIDWNKNLYGYMGRELCKQAGNSEGGLAYRMLDLGGCRLDGEVYREMPVRINL